VESALPQVEGHPEIQFLVKSNALAIPVHANADAAIKGAKLGRDFNHDFF
jgi:hypothetical protein